MGETISSEKIARLTIPALTAVIGLLSVALILDIKSFVLLVIILSVAFNIRFLYTRDNAKKSIHLPQSALVITLGIMMYYPNNLIINFLIGLFGVSTIIGILNNQNK